MPEKIEQFFKNRNLIYTVDALSKRYGKTPYEVLTEMTVYEFSFNVAVMVIANIEDENAAKNIKNKSGKVNWKSLGIDKKTIKKKRNK